jgi:hypothetical protein
MRVEMRVKDLESSQAATKSIHINTGQPNDGMSPAAIHTPRPAGTPLKRGSRQTTRRVLDPLWRGVSR